MSKKRRIEELEEHTRATIQRLDDLCKSGGNQCRQCTQAITEGMWCSDACKEAWYQCRSK